MREIRHMPPNPLKLIAVSATMTLIATLLSVMQPTPVYADTAPIPPLPSTVSTDVLPTPQIDGVVWDQVIVGNTVYVSGNFSKARPFGSALGTNEVDRSYVLAYNLTTGALLPWAPTFNSQVRALAASPDGTRLYAVGDFTTVNGVAKNRIVAFDTATGSINNAFDAGANYRVYAVVATNTTVFFSGPFTSVSGNTRLGGAAALAANGAITAWSPELAGGRSYGIVVSPDETKVVIGGDFTTVNGSGNPGYGLAMLDATAGALITPFTANNSVRNGGINAAIFSLASDSDSFYGSGYVYGTGGNLEGTFRANWSNGAIVWINDCHGDTYSVSPAPNGAVYAAGHPHYCGNIDGFPQTDPWTFSRGVAFSKEPTGTISNDPYGYPNWVGNASPSLLNFFPDINLGTFTGQFQGPWDVTSNGQYAVYGGEFTRVNGQSQQGLLRFAVPSIAPNLDGPRLTGDNLVPSMSSPEAGTIALSWPANWDRDNETLTYHLIRDGKSASPIYVTTQSARFYDRPTMTYVDTGLTPGQTYTYRLRAIDPYGNNGWGTTVSFTAGSGGTLSDYAKSVMNDQPTNYWRLGDGNGNTAVDSVRRDDAIANAGVGFGATGAIIGDSNKAANFTGNSNSFAVEKTLVWRDNTFSVEAWFKTNTNAGGKIVGFGSRQTGNSNNYDRHIYMDTAGRVNFGVYTGSTRIVQSAKTYNDNQWHQVVGSMGASGMELFVDGVRIGVDPNVTWGQNYWGYWRIGGDNSWSGAAYFSGAIDEVAVYPKPLTATQVQNHYLQSGRALGGPPAPSDNYGAAVYGASPQLYWRLNETSGTVANDSGSQGINGTLSGTYTRNVPGALNGTTNTATRFTQGAARTAVSLANPATFSSEVWFKTTTTSGGKLTGFGSSATGTSSNYGDHVIMRNNGTLLFGTSTSTIATTQSLNDGLWHHVVATQGSSGLRLYVDGALAATSSANPSQTFSGYWRLGGDNTGGASSSNFFNGDLDEFAIYQTVLSPSDVSAHYLLGTANEAPVAAFTHSESNLVASFDASTSSDPDGTIEAYAWNFGDGSAGTGAVVNHTYASAGTYSVVVTVTDNKGATSTATASVTVTAPNVAPTAAFSSEVSENLVAFDAAASSDPDGTIISYAWSFGDGATGDGITPSHAYAAAGDYTVTLTVTDNQGATGAVTRVVSALAPPVVTVLARDEFSRTQSSGWGTADVGGLWSTNSDSSFSVASGVGVVTHGTSGSTRSASLPTVSTSDVTVSASISVDKPITGGGAFTGVIVRQVGSEFYQARVRYFSNGTLAFQLLSGGSTSIAYTELPGMTFTAGDVLMVKAQAFGTSPTTVRGKVWKAGTAEPTGWTLEATSFIPGLQAAGSVGQYSYLSGSATNSPVRVSYDSFLAVAGHADGGGVPVNQAPTAAFTSSVSGLTATFNSTASADPDGSIDSRAWDFGDGQSSTATNPVHSYASAGTYQVSLTVTDNQGATATVIRPVTVAAAPVNQAPTAAFTFQVTENVVGFNASTSADPDGTISNYQWDFGDGDTGTGMNPSHSYAAAGDYTVTLTVTDNQGATGAVTRAVTALAPPAVTVLARDEFSRTVASGWGTAVVGGNWSTNANSDFTVASDAGVVIHSSTGSTRHAWLPSVSTDDVTVSASISVDRPITGGGAYTGLTIREVGSNFYQARVRYFSNGSLAFQLLNGSSTSIAYTEVAGLTFTAGDVLMVKAQAFGTSPTTLRGKVWKSGTPEPTDWTLSATSSVAGLQTAGSVGQYSYLSGSATNPPVRVSYDSFLAVAGHAEGGVAPVNQAPTAAFTSSVNGLVATFNSSTSADPDGTIASRVWDFGDGQSSTATNPVNTYASAGTYQVSLTVTDNQGATGTVTHPVTVAANPVNQAPVAAFTLDLNGLAATFNGNGSTDPDGSIASYAWNFGDGQTAPGATSLHSYAAAGSYTVTLTVTDNQGSSRAVTHVVAPNTVADIPEPAKTVVVIMENKSNTQIIGNAQAPFINSLVSDGALMTQSFAVARPSQPNYFALFGGSLNGVASNDCPNTFTTTNLYNQLTANGKTFVGYSESLPSVGFTGCESGAYARKHNPWVNWPSIPAAVNQPFTAFPTDYATLPTVSFVVPDLNHDMHDGTIAEADTWMQSALGGYVAWAKANNSVLILTWDENDGGASNQIPTIFVGEKVKIGQFSQTVNHYDVLRTIQDAYSLPSNDLSAAAAPITNIWVGANQTPTAAFTSTTTGLSASFNGSTSSDPDGTISSYAWNFGDGQSGTGATATHDYATGGNYTVILTVTDNQGGTGSLSRQITVTAPGGPIAEDDFNRTVAAGWGTATTGGAWTTNANSDITVSGGTGIFLNATPGSTRRALLSGVSVTNVEAQVAISADKVAESGHTVIGIIGRQVGSAFYQARARLQPGGAVGLQIMSGSSTVLANMTVPGLTYSAGDTLILKTSVSGTNPTTITAKLWRSGDAEPAGWQLSTTDSTAALQAAGSIGFESYLSSSAPNAPVTIRFDNFLARLPQ
ncbi:hypothetical protein A20C1_09269 [marine actinobacterium PHSC20C1]|nr:hypothetical protein A20C1_09269 [marine actinobacterium PHSC20C1]